MPRLRDRKHRIGRAVFVKVSGYKSIPCFAAAPWRIAASGNTASPDIFRLIALEFVTFELAVLHGAFGGCAAIRRAVLAWLAIKAMIALTLIFWAWRSVSLLSRRRGHSYSLCRRRALVPILC